MSPAGPDRASGVERDLRSFQFRRERERTWRELERSVRLVEKGGIAALSAEDLARLPVLYRATLSSLSVARAISLDRALLEYLEALTGRAYFCVYGPRRRLRSACREFVTLRLPRLIRRRQIEIGLAGALLVLGGVTGFALTARDPEFFYGMVPESLAGGRGPEATRDFLRSGLYDTDRDAGALALFASHLFSHNSSVGFLAFAVGFLGGVPAALLMFLNGMILGAMSAVYHERGLAVDWWGWVLPHGVAELFAIVLCGGAGLVLGRSVVFPGRRRRLDNLALHGREAGALVMGAVGLLLFAALIEGIFRQTVTDLGLRYAVVLASAIGLAAYCARAGREPRR